MSDRRIGCRDWERGRERRSRDYRDYERSRRERFSPARHELSPPQKRLRRDWDDHAADPYHAGYELPYSGGGGAGPTYGPPQAPWGPHEVQHPLLQHQLLPIQARLGSIAEVELGAAPPVLKSFKEFLLSLDDAVDETEAVKRYNDYKLDFRRQQLQDFFLAHKDEEWYPKIIKNLGAAVIKMEGGTEHDLRILEQEEEEERAEKAEGQKKEEPRPPEPPGKGSAERPEGADGAKAEGAEPGAEPAPGAGPEQEEAGPDTAPQAEEGDKEGGAKDIFDPLRFFRRGWVTFDRSVNIKEICWSLQNIRLRECELSPGVNRDLTRRVRNVSGLTQHRPVVRHDIKLAARLVQALDARARLWSPPGAEGDADATAEPPPTQPGAQNPVLRHITDYLIVSPVSPAQNPVLRHITDYLIVSQWFFNNFLMDPKRPALPEGGKGPPGLAAGALPYPPQSPQGLLPYGSPRPPALGYGGSHPYPPGPYGGRGSYETFRGQGGAGGGYLNKPRSRLVRGDPRAIVEYRDLDAPEDVDFF
uniref:serrate RNA effector molecule homolog n=1 Tax=Lonchura striata TaxID=40157 RepID=UPI001293F79C|nr:serrate RNA effector molecule homolog [Lonchura striata domestica]